MVFYWISFFFNLFVGLCARNRPKVLWLRKHTLTTPVMSNEIAFKPDVAMEAATRADFTYIPPSASSQ
jgi:hypothetical protein